MIAGRKVVAKLPIRPSRRLPTPAPFRFPQICHPPRSTSPRSATMSSLAPDVPESSTSSSTVSAVKYISAQEAASIDEELMSPNGAGYLLPQLMELAGLACASAVFKSYPPDVCPHLLVAAGPGNQGGDGLVAARHAKLWGYDVQVWYPKQGKADIFESLRKQLEAMQVEFLEEDDFEHALQTSDVVLDSIFGFSFQGPPRPPFASALEALGSESRLEFVGRVTRPPIVSVDIPSGWSVDEGNTAAAASTPTDGQQAPPLATKHTFTPEVVLSLTAPKKGMKGYRGTHFLGGRFVPPSIVEKYGLEGLDGYELDEQIVDISGWADADDVVE